MENSEKMNEVSVIVRFSPEAWKSPCELIFGDSSSVNISKNKEIFEPNFKVVTDKEITVLLKCGHTDLPEIPTPKEHTGILKFNPTPFTFEKGKTYLIYINNMNGIEITEQKSQTDNENN